MYVGDIRPADIGIRDEGSIYLLTPLTEAGRDWMREHLPEDATRFGPATVVEWRFLNDIAQGMIDDGPVVGRM